MSNTIVFVHGFMTTGHCWENWKSYFEKQGYNCIHPSWPYLDKSVKELRESPSPNLTNLDFQGVINHYISIIEELDDSPILIGHSLGGVIVQKLLSLGYGSAAVCINSGPPKGVFALNRDFLFSNLQLVNPFSTKPLRLMSPKWYNKYVTNEMSLEDTITFMDKHCVPSSKKVATSLATQGSIDFTLPHHPLLFISGDKDRSQPAIINQKNYQLYTDPTSITTYKEFKGRTHNSIHQKGWQEMAEYILNWLDLHHVSF